MRSGVLRVAALFAAGTALPAPSPGVAQRAAEAEPRIERLDPRFDGLVPADAALQRIAEGFTWLEGPLWHPTGRFLLFSDIPSNRVFSWDPETGVRVFLERSGYSGSAPFRGREPGSNGLAWDAQGRLVLCEHGNRRITRLEADGRRVVLADRYQGKRLNSPNDLVFTSSGDLYFTDPPFGLPDAFADPAREIAWSGVYRLTPSGTLTLVTTEVRAPNGIAFSPDERTLYVSNADPSYPVVLSFDVGPDGTVGAGRMLFDATAFNDLPGGPDGIEVDEAGNLFAVGPGGVYVLAPDGAHLGTIVTGVATSNVAWGGDGSDLYVTAGPSVYRIRLSTKGAR